MQQPTFNTEQQRVISATGGHHLVLAPPGCGKTAVLAGRIAHAISHGTPVEQMACLTFTNRAARAMRERIGTLHPSPSTLDSLFVGNVHRFCLHYLFNEHIVAGNSAVIDTDTSISIIADYLGEDELRVLDDSRSRQRYSQIINLQHLMRQCRQQYPSHLVVHREVLSPRLLNELCKAYHLPYTQQSATQLYMQSDFYRDEPAQLSPDARQLLSQLYAARQYERYKEQNDLLDFEDLLLTTYETLTASETAATPSSAQAPSSVPGDAIAATPSSAQAPSSIPGDAIAATPHQYSWLQIDEVQDLNPLQLAIVDAFTAPGATVVYLGDAQQAIFSFMGAKTDTLAMLRQRCGEDHFYNFFQNYRSPQYLLDVFNRYAQWQLGIDPALLPTTSNHTPRQGGDVQLMEAPTNIDEANMVARCVNHLYEQHPEESIAVVVAFNNDADEVSAALGQLPHFKISGTDFFATPPMRLLLAHLGVLSADHSFLAWAHLLSGLQVYASNSSARQAVSAMQHLAIAPSDVLLYDGTTTYVAEFVKAYEQQELVVFDTETTGLDVLSDDVVQIAAVRVSQGRVTDELNLFIETTRPLPEMLGDVENPLIDEYRQHPHLQPAEALQRFVQFAQGCAIVGHNTTYDYQIMEHNMQRYAPQLSMHSLWPTYFDTLKLARLLHPRQPSYKLRDLLVQLSLEGHNSHLANDDILATLSLATHCYDLGRSIMGRQLEFLSRHRQKLLTFSRLYGPLYHEARKRLYQAWRVEGDGSPLSVELLHAYRYFTAERLMTDLPKLKYIIKYIDGDLLTPAEQQQTTCLAQQLAGHYTELCTLKEADLCGSSSMTERVFVSTVHKAKGLEFDTVVVYDAVDGKYPSPYASYEAKAGEEARKFYVAITRARRRLIVTYCHNAISRWGAWHAKVLTPYMASITSMFNA